uniref:Uncharacterized protein n=1 Tax=Anopheles culicifacies TaxID=139723 RepID=A0A182MW27_9DIPT
MKAIFPLLGNDATVSVGPPLVSSRWDTSISGTLPFASDAVHAHTYSFKHIPASTSASVAAFTDAHTFDRGLNTPTWAGEQFSLPGYGDTISFLGVFGLAVADRYFTEPFSFCGESKEESCCCRFWIVFSCFLFSSCSLAIFYKKKTTYLIDDIRSMLFVATLDNLLNRTERVLIRHTLLLQLVDDVFDQKVRHQSFIIFRVRVTVALYLLGRWLWHSTLALVLKDFLILRVQLDPCQFDAVGELIQQCLQILDVHFPRIVLLLQLLVHLQIAAHALFHTIAEQFADLRNRQNCVLFRAHQLLEHFVLFAHLLLQQAGGCMQRTENSLIFGHLLAQLVVGRFDLRLAAQNLLQLSLQQLHIAVRLFEPLHQDVDRGASRISVSSSSRDFAPGSSSTCSRRSSSAILFSLSLITSLEASQSVRRSRFSNSLCMISVSAIFWHLSNSFCQCIFSLASAAEIELWIESSSALTRSSFWMSAMRIFSSACSPIRSSSRCCSFSSRLMRSECSLTSLDFSSTKIDSHSLIFISFSSVMVAICASCFLHNAVSSWLSSLRMSFRMSSISNWRSFSSSCIPATMAFFSARAEVILTFDHVVIVLQHPMHNEQFIIPDLQLRLGVVHIAQLSFVVLMQVPNLLLVLFHLLQTTLRDVLQQLVRLRNARQFALKQHDLIVLFRQQTQALQFRALMFRPELLHLGLQLVILFPRFTERFLIYVDLVVELNDRR